MSSPVSRSALGIAVTALAAALTLSACSSSSSNGGDPPASSATPTSSAANAGGGNGGAAQGGSGQGGSGQGQRGPAASGTIAAISGTTMQVQNQQTGQVAVTWTSTTKFSHQITMTLAAIKAGTCVTAIAPSGTSATATSFTASTVTISTATNGECGGGFGGGNRPSGRPSSFPSGLPSGGQRPSGVPSGIPSGARPGGGNFGAIATGKVSSVSGSTLVIAARQFTPGSSSSPSTTNKTITIGSGTKILTEASTTAGSLKVGLCATAEGKADSSGTVTATSVRITQPTNGQCTIGFGGRSLGG